jgi:Uma2 family endonuclease
MDDASNATPFSLYHVEGQAELVNGKIVRPPFHDFLTARIIMEIVTSLYDFNDRAIRGEVFTSTLGYVVPRLPSGRESFCPDASFYDGPPPANPMRFVEGPPTFAVEVRSENDHGPAAEEAMADKRADYFAAGTLVVWDVDPDA